MCDLFFSRHSQDRRFYNYGSSKELLHSFFDFIDAERGNIVEINLCLYLYNNEILHNKMKELAEEGVSVNVISIPLEGYDSSNPQDIREPINNTVQYHGETKYSLAEKVYNDIIDFNNSKYSLYVFGHTYVRSSRMRNFARGTLPYSLHTKSLFIRLRDGRTITGLTSSNLAVRDASKDELMILIEDTPDSRRSSELFFRTLIENSTAVTDWENPYPNFCYHMNCTDAVFYGANYFAAPFFHNSPIRIDEKISEIIETARDRIYICAEHLAAYHYRDMHGNFQPGLFSVVFQKGREGIPVRCLSQTYVDAEGDSHGQRSPENTGMFRQLIRQIDQLDQCVYAVNKNVHAKFIVVDNTAVISTANYTPTEFIYGPVTINRFDDDSLAGVRYSGIFSEVSHFIILEDQGIAEQLIRFFEETVEQDDTYIHGQPQSPVAGTEERHYINCPYGEKDEAKALGARWDPDQKKWYYTKENQAYLFQRWMI